MTNENTEKFYFRVFDDGDMMVMVIDANGNYSQYKSTDPTEQRAISRAFKRHGDFWYLASGVCITK